MADVTNAELIETVDDPDLEAALDEADVEAGEPADAVLDAIDNMIEAIRKAVA